MRTLEALTGTTGSTPTKTQLRGNCQCCGRLQAVMNGRMAKHGYEVKDRGDWGYFEGVCLGANYAPMQTERTVTDRLVVSAREQAVELDRRAVQLRAGEIFPALIDTGRWDSKTRSTVTIPFDQGSAYEKQRAVEAAALQAESQARGARAWAYDMEKLANAVHGQPLQEVKRDAGPAPILTGEQRKAPRGILTAQNVFRGMVHWQDERGFKSKMATRSWRLLELVGGAT